MTNYVNPSTRIGGTEQIVVPERQTTVPVDDAPFDDEQYVRVNGEWVPYNAPPIIPDTLAPKPPTGLGATGTMAANGTRVDYSLEWDAPTQNTDNSPLTDFAYYVVRWRYVTGGVYQMFTTKETTFLLPSLVPGIDVEWSVLARDYSGNDSTWADDTIPGLDDTTPPNQPSLPQLVSRLGSIMIAWDGFLAGATLPPADFEFLEAYMSATTGGPWEPIGRLGGAGFLAVAGIPVGETRFFTFIAVDTSGNASIRSGESSIEVLGVEGPDLMAGSVTTNALAAGAVEASNLSAVLALVTKICSSTTGRRWEADADGIRVYESDGTILINFPTDPSTPSSFYGDLFASSLTVEDQLAIRGLVNEISKGAQLVLAGGTTAPTSAPVVTIDWERTNNTYASDASGGNIGRHGLVRWTKANGERWWFAQDIAGTYTILASIDDDGQAGLGGGDFFTDGMQAGLGGVTVLGSNIYVLGKVYSDYVNFKWRVHGYTSAGVKIADWEWVRPANGSEPTIWNNGTYIMVTWVQEDTHRLMWRPFNAATGAAISVATTLTGLVTPTGAVPKSAQFSAADFGVNRLTVVLKGVATVYVFDATAVYQPNETFPLASSDVEGVAFYAGIFWSHDGVARSLTKHTSTNWAAESSTWYASNTWYDGDAGGTGTHETAQSPRKSFTMKKRARLNLTTAILPVRPTPNTADDAKATRIYIGRGAADPGRTYMERMATLADGARNWTSSAITLPAGAATTPPPATSDFPASSPGKIVSADGVTIVLQGDGSFVLGGLVGSSTGTSGNFTDVQVGGASIGRGAQSGAAGYAQITANSTVNATSATPVDVPGLAVTFTAAANRRYRISFNGMIFTTVANDRGGVHIREGTTTLNSTVASVMTVAGNGMGANVQAIVTPSAGTHTYKIGLTRITGTGNINVIGATTAPASILVEDIGPA